MRQQNDEWKKQRVEGGQDPDDAAAFREHQKAQRGSVSRKAD